MFIKNIDVMICSESTHFMIQEELNLETNQTEILIKCGLLSVSRIN